MYGVGSVACQAVYGKLIKLNVDTKEFVTWEEPNGFPSEPAFVKAPGGNREDDGVILSCVINTSDQTTSLLVLDAKNFKEMGRAVFRCVTTPTFHGMFKEQCKDSNN